MDYGGYNQGQYGQQQSGGIETGTSYGAVGQPVPRRGRGRGRFVFFKVTLWEKGDFLKQFQRVEPWYEANGSAHDQSH